MATDIVQKTEEALCAILDTLASIVGLTGKPGGAQPNIVPWDALSTAVLPILTYEFVSSGPSFACGDTRSLAWQISAHVDGAGSKAKANALMEAVEIGLTTSALIAQGLDAGYDPSARPWPRGTSPADVEGVRGLVQHNILVTLVVTK